MSMRCLTASRILSARPRSRGAWTPTFGRSFQPTRSASPRLCTALRLRSLVHGRWCARVLRLPAGARRRCRASRTGGAAARADLGRSLAYAAALRVAHFGNANEHADWETAHHVFTYANAVHQMLKRIGTAKINGYAPSVRCVLHGAMALYLARYLNVPPARLPAGRASARRGAREAGTERGPATPEDIAQRLSRRTPWFLDGNS
jgi:hypothetical protein